MLNCPKCGKELNAVIPRDSATDRQDIEFVCPDEHLFFTRVSTDDLIDEND